MPTVHVVQQGECLSSIALEYGFSSYEKIYNHADNAEFKQARPDPNLIFPGDRLTIPDKIVKAFSCATGQAHRFVVKLPKRKLRLELLAGKQIAQHAAVAGGCQPLRIAEQALVAGAQRRLSQLLPQPGGVVAVLAQVEQRRIRTQMGAA